MKFPVLWLASVSLSVWVGTEKGVRLAWDLVSRSRISLHFGAKAERNQNQTKTSRAPFKVRGQYLEVLAPPNSETLEVALQCIETIF